MYYDVANAAKRDDSRAIVSHKKRVSHETLSCPEPESNQRHKDFQSFALPTELSGHVAFTTNIFYTSLYVLSRENVVPILLPQFEEVKLFEKEQTRELRQYR